MDKRQGSKWIRQWPINFCTSPMMIPKITLLQNETLAQLIINKLYCKSLVYCQCNKQSIVPSLSLRSNIVIVVLSTKVKHLTNIFLIFLKIKLQYLCFCLYQRISFLGQHLIGPRKVYNHFLGEYHPPTSKEKLLQDKK